MNYIKVKRNKVDICNICYKTENLSWDHVPPKGGIKMSPVEMETIFQKLVDPNKNNISISQNGLKYRTICKECNAMLGSRYDKVLNEFARSVGKYLTSVLRLPKIIYHKTKPVALMKGILGHLISSKIELDEVLFDKTIREILFDDKKAVPDDISIFYWIYPYYQTIVIRDFMMPSRRGSFNEFGFYQTLKYFPIAYLVSDKPKYEGLFELTKYRSLNIDDEMEIPIQLNRIEQANWPEIVDDKNLFFGGQGTANSIIAKPKTLIK